MFILFVNVYIFAGIIIFSNTTLNSLAIQGLVGVGPSQGSQVDPRLPPISHQTFRPVPLAQ